MKSIRKIISAPIVNMGGVHLFQPLPYKELDQLDPFLLIHHWSDTIKGGLAPDKVGVGPHPHRGFSPVTFIFKGEIHHRDSLGTSSIVEEGGTQWMNSGKGIIHSERPTKKMAEQGGDFEIIQFWVNTPARHKMDPPSYQPLKAVDTPKVMMDNGKIEISVVAGNYEKTVGKINASSELVALRLNISKGGRGTIKIPKTHNTLLYQLDGKLQHLGGRETEKKQMIVYRNDGETIEILGKEDTRAILLAGVPLNEPVATYGPFVMNTQREIIQSLQDYESGKMGHLTENFEN